MTPSTINHTDLIRALSLRDLTNPSSGIHAMQLLIDEIEQAVLSLWPCYLQRLNPNPIVPVHDNYDALGYPTDGAARDIRYSRYITEELMLRTQTSSAISNWLSSWRGNRPESLGLLVHGLVYRRDCIDRWHSAEPHQLDVWLINRKSHSNDDQTLANIIQTLLKCVLPNHKLALSKKLHPYTKNGIQIDAINSDNEHIEIGECGDIAPKILDSHGWDSSHYGGVAIGLGLDRILMLRKGLPDIRLLREHNPRVQQQMLTLSPWQSVSNQPQTKRDISIVVQRTTDMDVIGDKVRTVLADKVDWLEEIILLEKTTYAELPDTAIHRLGITKEQENLLLRLIFRHPSKSLTTELANELRNQIYLAIHESPKHYLA